MTKGMGGAAGQNASCSGWRDAMRRARMATCAASGPRAFRAVSSASCDIIVCCRAGCVAVRLRPSTVQVQNAFADDISDMHPVAL